MRTGPLFAAFLVLGLTACGEAAPPSSDPGPVGGIGGERAILSVRGFGEIELEFFEKEAPRTVAHFKKLAREGFYDGTTFHRVVPGFVIQGGDPNSRDRDPRNDGLGGPGYTIEDEFWNVPQDRGIVSMARTAVPDSAGSQFFIVLERQPHLDGHYTAFARVVRGMDVVDRIAAVPRDQFGRYGPRDRPLEDVVIERIEIVPEGEASGASTGEPTGDGTPASNPVTREEEGAGAAPAGAGPRPGAAGGATGAPAEAPSTGSTSP